MRKLKWVLCVLTAVASISMAQTQSKSQECPVKIEHTFVSASHNALGTLFIYWKNVSDKPITAVKFGNRYFDAVGDPHDDFQNYTSKPFWKVKPNGHPLDGKEWETNVEGYSKNEVWVIKVLFKDGSTWEDDGSLSCRSQKNKGK